MHRPSRMCGISPDAVIPQSLRGLIARASAACWGVSSRAGASPGATETTPLVVVVVRPPHVGLFGMVVHLSRSLTSGHLYFDPQPFQFVAGARRLVEVIGLPGMN